MGDYILELRRELGSRPLIICGATTLIFNAQQEILLQQRRDNQAWALPGGSMEPGETLEQTARRETREEVGLDLGELSLFDMYSGSDFYYVYPNGDQAYNVIAAYISRTYSGHLQIEPAEVLAAGFFALDQLPSPVSPPDHRLIQDYLARKKHWP